MRRRRGPMGRSEDDSEWALAGSIARPREACAGMRIFRRERRARHGGGKGLPQLPEPRGVHSVTHLFELSRLTRSPEPWRSAVVRNNAARRQKGLGPDVKRLRKLSLALASATLLSLPAVSHAVLISESSNNPYAFSWSYNTGTSLLTGSGTMSISGFNSSDLTVTVSLTNTSAIGGQGGERLVGFAFGIDPNATGSTVGFSDAADGGMVSASWASGALASNVSGVEVCAFGGVNCSGGSNGGIFAGASDTFRVLLSGEWGRSVNIDPIGLRYQTGYGSFTFASSSSSGNLPEPASASLVGLGLGMLGLGFARRRKSAS